MPNFFYRCDESKGGCGLLYEVTKEPYIENRPCIICGTASYVDWKEGAPFMRPDVWDNEWHPSIGQYNSRGEFNEKMKARGLMVDEAGMAEECARKREERLQKELKPIKDEIHKHLSELTPEQRKGEAEALMSGNYVVHPTHSPAGVEVTPQHIQQIVGGSE